MTVRRGEIYFVNLNPVEGREQAGHRPVLVLSRDAINRLPLVVTGGSKDCPGIQSPQTPVFQRNSAKFPMKTSRFGFLCGIGSCSAILQPGPFPSRRSLRCNVEVFSAVRGGRPGSRLVEVLQLYVEVLRLYVTILGSPNESDGQ